MKIGIVGCGIGGMASAILLAARGHQVTVLERFARPRPLGAGLLLQPTGLAVLDRLGLGERARALGARVQGIKGLTAGGRSVLALDYAELGEGCSGFGIHRGVLFDLLHGALGAGTATLVCEAEIVALDSQPDRATPIDAAGRRHGPFDLLLVCDGAHSSLRGRYAALGADPSYPWGCVWATLPDPDRRFADWLHQRFRSTTVMAGVLPVGRDPAHPQAPSSVTLFWSLRGSAMEDWRRGDFSAWRAGLAALWPELAPLLERLGGPDDFTQARYRDVALRRWRQGRVLFLGDACHGTSPQLGQGANLALLDAWTLARALERSGPDTVEAALDAVERRRRRQVDFYRQASRWLTPFYQSRLAPLGWLRDLAFGPACRFGPTRRFMLTTLAGLRRSWFASQPFDAAQGFDPDAD